MYNVAIYNPLYPEDKQWLHMTTSPTRRTYNTRLIEGINEIAAYSFDIAPQHSLYNSFEPLVTHLQIVSAASSEIIYTGRVLVYGDAYKRNGTINKRVTCESELAYLQDSSPDYRKVRDTRVEDFFRMIIEMHNAQVEPYKRFEIGMCDVANSTDNVYKYLDESKSTFDNIQTKLIGTFGGEIRIRKVDGVNYIDYLQEAGELGSQDIVFTKNLIDLHRNFDPSEIVTVLKPLGDYIEQGETTPGTGEYSAALPRLTIESVNGGDPFLYDLEKIEKYGVQVKPVVWTDVHEADILKRKGEEYLANQKSIVTQWDVNAVDLSLLKGGVLPYKVGNYHRIVHPYMEVDEPVRIIGKTTSIDNLDDCSLVIGDKISI